MSGTTELVFDVGVSNTQCHSVTMVWLKAAGWEKQVHVWFAQGWQELCLSRMGVEAEPGCHVLPHNSPEAGYAPLEPVLPCGGGGQTWRLFTLAEALEQLERQTSIFVICFNHTLVTWSIQNLFFPYPSPCACSPQWFPCACLQTASPWLYYGGFGYKFI